MDYWKSLSILGQLSVAFSNTIRCFSKVRRVLSKFCTSVQEGLYAANMEENMSSVYYVSAQNVGLLFFQLNKSDVKKKSMNPNHDHWLSASI